MDQRVILQENIYFPGQRSVSPEELVEIFHVNAAIVEHDFDDLIVTIEFREFVTDRQVPSQRAAFKVKCDIDDGGIRLEHWSGCHQ